ncbi:MAG: CRISPR-associated endonuclease Cas2 [Thermoplasmatales archaeon]
MYIIVVYDVDAARVSRVNRFLKRYVMWVQNSVFEGEISDRLLNDMISRLKKLVEKKDSFVIYTFRTKSYTSKILLGEQRSSLSNVI